MIVLPESINPGDTGHIAHSEWIHKRINATRVNVKAEGAAGDGVTDDSGPVSDAYAAAPDGAIMEFPTGVYLIDPDTIALLASRRIEGDGQYNSVIKLSGDTANAAILIDTPAPAGTTQGVYGPMVTGIGIDLRDAPSATGIKIMGDTGWAWLDDVRVEGGTVSVHNIATNTRITNSHFVDPSEHFFLLTEEGLELRLTDVIMTMTGLTAAVLPAAMKLTHATTGPSGAIYMVNVQCNNQGDIERGFWGVAPSGRASVPIIGWDVVFDNIAGPSWELEYIDDVKIVGGWANSAAGTDNPAIKITGGHKGQFIATKMNGGGGANASTIEFAGGSPYGWQFLGNDCNTGVIYRLSGAEAGDPTNLILHDLIPTGVAMANVTNEPERLRAAMGKLWTPLVMQQDDVRFVGTAGEPAFANGWANVVGQPAYFWVDSMSVVHLDGVVDGGSGGTIFTLPVGSRPFATASFNASDGAGGAKLLNVNADGTVVTLAPFGVLALSGVTFRVGG